MTEHHDGTEHLDDALHRAEQAISEAKAAEQAVEAVGGLPADENAEPGSPLEWADAKAEPHQH